MKSLLLPNMEEHYSTVLNMPIEKVFQYYSDFEKYTERYPLYCAQIDIEKSEDTTISNEIWMLTLGLDVSHVKVKIRYTLIKNKEIQYEFLDEQNKGMKNSFVFEERGNQTRIGANMVPLDMVAFSYGRKHPIYQDMITYFIRQDTNILENYRWGHKGGDICPICKKGKIERIGKSSRDENTNRAETRRIEYFVCDNCGKELQSAYLEFPA